MMYSCALWGPEEGGISGASSGGHTHSPSTTPFPFPFDFELPMELHPAPLRLNARHCDGKKNRKQKTGMLLMGGNRRGGDCEGCGGGGGRGYCKIDEGALDAAQMRKIRHVLDKACVRPGDRLLEFGTGWGALAIEVCQD